MSVSKSSQGLEVPVGDNRQHSSMVRAWALGCNGVAQAQDAEAEERFGVQLRVIVL